MTNKQTEMSNGPEFNTEPDFLIYGMDFMEPLDAYQTADRKLLRIKWSPRDLLRRQVQHPRGRLSRRVWQRVDLAAISQHSATAGE